jgi:hypothetical protein
LAGGSGEEVIWCAASVMAYASRTGALKAFSSSSNVVGEREDEHERIKRRFGIGDGCGDESRIWWMVGTAVYQLDSVETNSLQNTPALNLGGITTLPRARSAASKPACRPWTWKPGMTR